MIVLIEKLTHQLFCTIEQYSQEKVFTLFFPLQPTSSFFFYFIEVMVVIYYYYYLTRCLPYSIPDTHGLSGVTVTIFAMWFIFQ